MCQLQTAHSLTQPELVTEAPRHMALPKCGNKTRIHENQKQPANSAPKQILECQNQSI